MEKSINRDSVGKDARFLKVAAQAAAGEGKIGRLFNLIEGDVECAYMVFRYAGIAKLADKNGLSAAYVAAYHGEVALYITTDRPRMLALSDKEGWSVAHFCAYKKDAALEMLKNHTDVMKLKDIHGWSVAHIAARENKDVAVEIAKNYPELLKLATIDGYTVAHEAAFCKEAAEMIVRYPDIMQLEDKNGLQVGQIIETRYQTEKPFACSAGISTKLRRQST